MIPDEIGNEIDAKCDMQELKNNSRNKEMQKYQNQKGEAPALHEAYSPIEHLHKRNKASNIWTCKFRVVRKRPGECVCKE